MKEPSTLSAEEAVKISGVDVNFLKEELKKIVSYSSKPTPENEALLDLSLRDREVSSSQANILISLLQEDLSPDILERVEEHRKNYSGKDDYVTDFVRNHLLPQEEGYARLFLYIPEGRKEIPANPLAPIGDCQSGCPYSQITCFMQGIEMSHEFFKTKYYLAEKSNPNVGINDAGKVFNELYSFLWGAGARVFIEKRFCPSRGQCPESSRKLNAALENILNKSA